MSVAERVSGSFRDPSGFVLRRGSEIFRQVNQSYAENYDLLLSSGLYEELTGEGLLVSHTEEAPEGDAYRLLKPEMVPFISYPYEWCFSQLKEAALLTLDIQKRALKRGLWLKDASAFNVQFWGGRPVLIDTLSFEKYPEGRPWVAYQQFCRQFLAPLVLGSFDPKLVRLLRLSVEGLPLDVASRLAPWKTRLNLGIFLHIHAQAKASSRPERPVGSPPNVSPTTLSRIVESLETCVRSLQPPALGTEWEDYYLDTNYQAGALEAKRALVREFVGGIPNPKLAWDFGANTGEFSAILADAGATTVAWDFDAGAVEKAFDSSKARGDGRLLPLIQDLTNPSPRLGWALDERDSLLDRGPADLVMALALVHHLAIGNNVPLATVAKFFAQCGRSLIIEWVPKEDSQVQRMLSTREDVFTGYTQEGFETGFGSAFDIEKSAAIAGTSRRLYLMTAR